MKNKQIEKMANILCEAKEHDCKGENDCNCIKQATALYNADYRKQKQGKWLITAKGCIITCSNCKERVDLYYPDGTQTGLLPYCPYCGSKNIQ